VTAESAASVELLREIRVGAGSCGSAKRLINVSIEHVFIVPRGAEVIGKVVEFFVPSLLRMAVGVGKYLPALGY
jgi:hypothetical protein